MLVGEGSDGIKLVGQGSDGIDILGFSERLFVLWGLLSTETERKEEFDRLLGSKKALDVLARHFTSFLESERREEFVRFLNSEKVLGTLKAQFESFLCSVQERNCWSSS